MHPKIELDDNSSKEPLYQGRTVYAELAPSTVSGATDLGAPFFNVSERYHHIPEARNLTWTDGFFEDDDDVVAVFDLDYDAMESYYTSLGWVAYGLSLLWNPLFVLATVALTPCYLRTNVEWAVRAKHVAVTRDGIKFVQNRRPCGWGLACMDVGKSSKTIPFDKITDCDVQEPAGNECCCVPRVLYQVKVDTASSGHEAHELVIAGLRDPHGFKKLVWAMKRAQHQHHSTNTLDMMRAMPAIVEGDNTESNDIATLLREIRDELRQNNEAIQTMKPEKVEGTAPTEDARFV